MFGAALGYKTVSDTADYWQLEREYTIEGAREQPDAILGHFREGEARQPLAVVDANNWVRQGQTRKTTPVEHANPRPF